MKLILAEHQALLSECLARQISENFPGCQITKCGDYTELCSLIAADKDFNAAIISLDLPGLLRLRGIKKIQDSAPAVPIMVISSNPSRIEAHACVGGNIKGYASTSFGIDSFVKALHSTLKGDEYIPYQSSETENQSRIITDAKSNKDKVILIDIDGQDKSVHLTSREYEVLKLLAQGMSNKEIARDLDLQEVTIKVHLTHVFRKLSANNRTQAVKKAMMMGLVPFF